MAEKDVYDVLADVKHKFHIDEDRAYLTGLSMGGAARYGWALRARISGQPLRRFALLRQPGLKTSRPTP